MSNKAEWEYVQYRLPADHFSGHVAGEVDGAGKDAVNSFGSDGWELVSVVGDIATATEMPFDSSKSGFVLFFKRLKD